MDPKLEGNGYYFSNPSNGHYFTDCIIMLKRNINILSPFDWWYGLIYFFLTLEDFFVRVKFVMTRWILTLKNNRFLLFNEFPVQQRRRFMPSVWLDYEAKYWGWHQKVIDIMRISLFFLLQQFSFSSHCHRQKTSSLARLTMKQIIHTFQTTFPLLDLKDKIKALAC